MKKSLKYMKKTHKKNSKKLQRFKKTLKYKKTYKKTRKNKYKKYLGGMRVKNKSGEIRDEEEDYILQEGEEEADKCGICLDYETAENPLVILHNPQGNAPPHKFHVGCIEQMHTWKDIIPHRLPINCPTCRAPVSDGPLIEQLIARAKVKELINAVTNGNIKLVNELIQAGANVNAKNSNGVTALMAASQDGHLDCIDILLSNGADVNAKDNRGRTALMFASFSGLTHKCMEMLLARGADVNAKNNTGITALMLACREGHISCIKMLVAKGADVNAKDNKGRTALMYASQKGHSEAVKFLKESGAV